MQGNTACVTITSGKKWATPGLKFERIGKQQLLRGNMQAILLSLYYIIFGASKDLGKVPQIFSLA